MLVKQLAGLLGLMVVFVLSCSDHPCEPCRRPFIYPLQVGNQWEYARLDSAFNYRSGDLRLLDSGIRDTSHAEVVRTETLPGGVSTRVIHETRYTQWGIYEGEAYYRNHPDGLYRHAGRLYPDLVPMKPARPSLDFRSRTFASKDDIIRFLETGCGSTTDPSESLRIYDPPIKKLSYPLRVGSRWMPNPEAEWPVERVVLGQEVIEVPAGTYTCLVVQLLHDFDEDDEWDDDFEYLDYICDQGLIRRHVFLKDIAIISEWGDTLAVYDVIMDSDLIRISIR
jgi:hypothetical protein